MRSMGILLLVFGGILMVVGLILLVVPRIPWLGRLPGDVHYRGRNTTIYFPITTCAVLSVLLTLLVNVVLRFFRR